MKKIKDEFIVRHVCISIISIIFLFVCFYFVTKYENKSVQISTDKELDLPAIDGKSKNESDAEAAKENTMLDFTVDRVWFHDPANRLTKLPISANVLKSEMVTKYLRENGYSKTESVTVLDNVTVKDSNYTFSCQIDGTDTMIVISWDSLKGLFSYYIKLP